MIIDANVGYGGPASYYYDVQSVWVWSGGRVVTPPGPTAGRWIIAAARVATPGAVAGLATDPGAVKGKVGA